MNLDIELQAKILRERIEAAFTAAPIPTRDSMMGHGSLDEIWCAERLGGVPRETIPGDELFNLSDCLSYIPPEAIRYFLPRFLMHVLEPGNRFGSDLDCTLSYLDHRNRHEYPAFSKNQLGCVIDWLSFVRDYADAFDLEPHRKSYDRRVRAVFEQWSSVSTSSNVEE
ncbi:MAG: hypothetical protein M3552_20175 [Planctomycetota bacterium]|nr:hypothetical protein [Planctomycetota bacterium]